MKKRYIIISVVLIAVAVMAVLVSVHIQKANKHQGYLMTTGNFIGDVVSEDGIVFENLGYDTKREEVLGYCTNNEEELAHLEEWLKKCKILRVETIAFDDLGLEKGIVMYQFYPQDNVQHGGKLGDIQIYFDLTQQYEIGEAAQKLTEAYDNLCVMVWNTFDEGSIEITENSYNKDDKTVKLMLENGSLEIRVDLRHGKIYFSIMYDRVN